ncbi:hypothetical protein [Hydrococcus rivularis]|uniref:hypothetical protein n=1 Tax=Hydrococcus rivularis TaxID=1616834 RepID=UPI000A7FC65D|nr:hypothetical protein [Hydrococcus rivularis]
MALSTLAVGGQIAWKRIKPVLIQETVLLPAIGFAGLIVLWWLIALFRRDMMPTPLKALTDILPTASSRREDVRSTGVRDLGKSSAGGDDDYS